ncbi:unnamed protein product [Rhizophagus irregularis]|uniref:Uncharacterized protein n=1 Tax=Rhizophagus irregularis TaxID=588596 RepID=A0A915ZM67_9GLOM|nr:unnamed protein product [Rhizophagus irregularis]
MRRILRHDHVINLFQVCNFKYKKCLTEIEDKYDPLTKEGSLKKSFKICVGSELMEMLTADTKNHKIDVCEWINPYTIYGLTPSIGLPLR